MQRVSQAGTRLATDAPPRPIRVVAAIIEDRGRVLICRRRDDQPFAGQWEFPGGKVEPSETPRAALARELREELAATARIGREVYVLQHHYPGMAAPVRVHFFRASLRGRPRNVCFARIAWARRGDLPRYRFLGGNRVLVARLARGEFKS